MKSRDETGPFIACDGWTEKQVQTCADMVDAGLLDQRGNATSKATAVLLGVLGNPPIIAGINERREIMNNGQRVVTVTCHDPNGGTSYPFSAYAWPSNLEENERNDDAAIEQAERAAALEFIAQQNASDADAENEAMGVSGGLVVSDLMQAEDRDVIDLSNYTAVTGVWFEGAVVFLQELT